MQTEIGSGVLMSVSVRVMSEAPVAVSPELDRFGRAHGRTAARSAFALLMTPLTVEAYQHAPP